jgi:predicted transcriptional regulator
MYPELMKLMSVEHMKHWQLGKLLGISQQAASKKIKGVTEFKLSEMQKIKEHFSEKYPGIIMDQIFTKDIFLAG